MKVEAGKTYVVKVIDRQNVEVIKEITSLQMKIISYEKIINFSVNFLKCLLVLSVLIFPPNIFFIRRKHVKN